MSLGPILFLQPWALLGLLALPLLWLLLRATPPESQDIQAARAMAAGELEKLGGLNPRELRLVVVLLGVMADQLLQRRAAAKLSAS